MFILAISQRSSADGGHCIWYDTCGWDTDYGPDGGNKVHFLNCFYEGPGQAADEEQLALIKELCPHMYTEGQVGYHHLPSFSFLEVLLLHRTSTSVAALDNCMI